jgi:ABC-type sugar transport system, permease component
MKKKKINTEWAWIIGLLAVGCIWMIPLIFMVSMSFRTPEKAFEPVLFTTPVIFDNFKTVISQNPLYLNFIASGVVTVSSVAIVALIASMTAFGLSRKGVKGKNIIYNLLMITLMVPISALVIPLTQINSSFNWLNKYQGLIFPYAALGIPFAMVILKGFMDEFPAELEDAATVDGCGNYRLFAYIVIPSLKPGLVVVIIWQFLTSWNEFFLALVTLNDKNMKTLTLIPMQYQGFYFSQPGCLFAILVIISIPMIVFYALVQKNFVKGLMSGAVKG